MKLSICTLLLSITLLLGNSQANSIKYNEPYNEEKILAETHWKELKIRKHAPNHLALISQGKFDENLIEKFDSNYYYPASAGEGIDIFIFDFGFNFTKDEFSDRDKRTIKCEAIVTDGVVHKSPNEIVCDPLPLFHGTGMAAIAAGKDYGVANKANIYALLFDEEEEKFYDSIIAGLKYVRDNLLKPHKAVFSFSFGELVQNERVESGDLKELQDLITEISEMGSVFFAAAGNEHSDIYDDVNQKRDVPCTLENVICVGGIANMNIDDNTIIVRENNGTLDTSMKAAHYRVAEGITGSNYGRAVDIYAPYAGEYHGKYDLFGTYEYLAGLAYTLGMDFENLALYNDGEKEGCIDAVFSGTSVSTPIAAGVAATIMSDKPEIKFTSKIMLQYLQKIGIKDILSGIPEGCPNIFINNGKNSIYSGEDFKEFIEEPELLEEIKDTEAEEIIGKEFNVEVGF